MTIITTLSRKSFDFTNPKLDSILIEDIANGLSMSCRFSGQITQFYSVAQHSCWVADLLWVEYERFNIPQNILPKVVLMGLLHDASEAYTGDINKPLKEMLPQFKRIENLIQTRVYTKFCIGQDIVQLGYKYVKWADDLAYAAERNFLLEPTKTEYEIDVAWNMATSKRIFLEFFDSLIN